MKVEWKPDRADERRAQEREQKPASQRAFFATTLLFLSAMFLLGRAIADTVYELSPTTGKVLSAENWGLGFGAEGAKPTGNATAAQLKEYNAYYVGEGDEKVIYLTFDCGYENGNTEPILDALKKHNVSATFFVVGHYLESAPELVKRMVEDA